MILGKPDNPMSPTGVRPVPLHVVTGFLGSGKTTLLRRLLATRGWQRTAVVINEFGDEATDLQSQAVGNDPVIIDRGCACCNMIEPMRRAIYDLFADVKRGIRPPFDRILLETSGLSDPAPILSTLMNDRVLQEYVAPGHVVTTVDALNAQQQIRRQPEFEKQLVTADLIVVTKEDLAPRQTVSELRCRLTTLNPAARMVAAGEPFVLPGLLDLPEQAYFHDRPPRRRATPAVIHGDAQSFTLTYDRHIDWSAFVVWLTMMLNKHGQSILRVKGLLMGEDGGSPLMIHGVQHVMHPPQHLRDWRGRDLRSKLVFIVRGVEPDAIETSFKRFLAWSAR